ncbi:MAG: hypothetical protein OEU93_16355 [Rubrivivax sp.]|nr:hypothetical protein [Rubrivivax sp.]MDH5340580.1 hypothetical protein [Rubrivivax sp.]
MPDPLDAGAVVPPLVHHSTLASYRRLGDDKPVPWLEANETVGRIGGWRAYAREAAEPLAPQPRTPAATAAPTPAAAASAPSRPAPAGHGGHSGHKMD